MNEALQYQVAVRALCEFTAKRGDLDLRFTPAPTAREGMAGHALVAARRGAGYQREVSLSGDFKHLHVRGRADGYDPDAGLLEEVKTFRGKFEAIPDNHRHLHWAQARVYGWLLCQKLKLPELRIALVYLDIASQEETVLSEVHTADALREHFESLCSGFLDWSARELAHRTARDAALEALAFPHAAFRPGQRALAEAVYKAANQGRCLLAQAPTGIGKTVGTLFPLLKACATRQIDKIYFLAAKTSGRAVALHALQRIAHAASALPMRLRVLELVARDKACEYPDRACHGDSCPLAKGFYDRLPTARSAALASGLPMDQAMLRQVALDHQVCPYYLSQDLVRWSDVVVGDYNYYFDTSALLHALATTGEWRVSLLVDEAHNLVERARQMYSAELHQASLAAVRRTAPAALKAPLDRLHRSWNELHRDQQQPYQTHAALPKKFLASLQQVTAEITAWLAEQPAAVESGLQRFYFDALHFCRMAEVFSAHSLFDVTLLDPSAQPAESGQSQGLAGFAAASVLCLRNVLPAPFLGPRFEAAQSATLFSATLNPWDFYSDMLGLPDRTLRVDVDSPFAGTQLSVQVARHVSTRYQHRPASLQPVVQIMATQYRRQPGNYLAFFSSFDYLQQVMERFTAQHPDIPVREQTRRMDEAGRAQFLGQFRRGLPGVGFAVLGGSFSEGIDLPGEQLIGAFIATLGLPQVNPVNEQVRQRMNEIFGEANGYDYTYLFPGLRKVVQAAGRVIRTPEDEGVVYLMDDRFARPEVLKLLPAWWTVKHLRAPLVTPESKPAPAARPASATAPAEPRGNPCDHQNSSADTPEAA